jgi:hypothetical protein
MNAQADVFGVQREQWLETIRGNLPLWNNIDSHLQPGETQADGDLEDPNPVIRLMNRQHAGLDLDPVEVYEALLPMDSVIIGDPDTCRTKFARYDEMGVDRLMCLMNMGYLEHKHTMQSIRTVGKRLLPELMG